MVAGLSHGRKDSRELQAGRSISLVICGASGNV